MDLVIIGFENNIRYRIFVLRVNEFRGLEICLIKFTLVGFINAKKYLNVSV